MGGRGAGSKISPPPKGGKGKPQFANDALMPRLPEDGRDAIGTKGRPMSIQKAYAGANPFFSANYTDFSQNCQRCVVAYELRRRGYDVTAQPTFENDTLPNIRYTGKNSELRQGAWTSAFRHARPVSVGASNEAKVYDNIRAQMKSYGEGSRAVISVAWKQGGGHVFNVENKNGRIVYVDGQTGERYSGKDVLRYAKPSNVTLTRVDNLRVSGKIDQFVWREKRR